MAKIEFAILIISGDWHNKDNIDKFFTLVL